MILAGDIGGTKARLGLWTPDGHEHASQSLPSGDYASLETLIADFLHQQNITQVTHISLGIAGPVATDSDGTYVATTNLPWRIEQHALAQRFSATVGLYNDLVAVGYGAISTTDAPLVLNPVPQQTGPAVVLAAGTGLGAALFYPQSEDWQCQPSEAGHVDFAPVDDQQVALLNWLRTEFAHVSYERILSGDGFSRLYRFCCQQQGVNEVIDLTRPDANAAITAAANQQTDPAAVEAVALFARIMGAKAGNLALTCLPSQGVYLAGNISGVIAPFLQTHFMPAFTNKGRFESLLADIPVFITANPRLGLYGAYQLAKCEQE